MMIESFSHPTASKRHQVCRAWQAKTVVATALGVVDLVLVVEHPLKRLFVRSVTVPSSPHSVSTAREQEKTNNAVCACLVAHKLASYRIFHGYDSGPEVRFLTEWRDVPALNAFPLHAEQSMMMVFKTQRQTVA